MRSLLNGSLFKLMHLYPEKERTRDMLLLEEIHHSYPALENRWMIANSNFSGKSFPASTLFILSAHALSIEWLSFQAYAFVPGKRKDERHALARGNPSFVPSAGKSMDDRKL